jgi:hypothetical protein
MNENAIANWLSKIEGFMREASAARARESNALLQSLDKLTDAIKQHGQKQQTEALAQENQRGE